MNPHLFVYGTLMSHTRTEKALRLGREAELIGPATLRGLLYRISWYPGLVEGDGRVHGEVHRLKDPAASLVWLDAYESIVPGRADNEYERVERIVDLDQGGNLTAWVYFYRADTSAAKPVADGRWT